VTGDEIMRVFFLPLKKKTKTGNSLVLKYEKNGKNG
jgi:hypothetical protein